MFLNFILEPPQPQDANTPDSKTNICEDIFKSHFFIQKNTEYVDPTVPDVFEKLKTKKYGDIFKILFQKDPQTIFTVYKKSTYTYTNAYKTKEIKFDHLNLLTLDLNDERPPTPSRPGKPGADISLGGHKLPVVIEHVFLCITKDRLTKKFQKWYVSKEYVTSEKHFVPRIVGRFVFEEEKYGFELVAFAEEPAQTFLPTNLSIEDFYLDLKKNHRPGRFLKIE